MSIYIVQSDNVTMPLLIVVIRVRWLSNPCRLISHVSGQVNRFSSLAYAWVVNLVTKTETISEDRCVYLQGWESGEAPQNIPVSRPSRGGRITLTTKFPS